MEISTVLSALLLLLLTATTTTAISSAEIDSTLAALRSHGYNLFANALTTSDLLFDLHSNLTTQHGDRNNATSTSVVQSFTLFAPLDSALFALDMTSNALVYTQTLRYHIVPRRVSAADLLRMRPGTCLPTLLARRVVSVHRRPLIAIDGVNVVVPGIFYGRSVAVHGLGGILNFRSARIGGRHGYGASAFAEMKGTSSNSPENLTECLPANRTFIPLIPRHRVVNGSVFSPIPRLPLFNFTFPPPPDFSPSPVPSSVISAPPVTSAIDGSTSPVPSSEIIVPPSTSAIDVFNTPVASSGISSPPMTSDNNVTDSPELSPSHGVEAVVGMGLDEALTFPDQSSESTEHITRRNARLQEVDDLALENMEEGAAADQYLIENHIHKMARSMRQIYREDEHEVDDGKLSDDEAQLSEWSLGDGFDRQAHYTGFEL